MFISTWEEALAATPILDVLGRNSRSRPRKIPGIWLTYKKGFSTGQETNIEMCSTRIREAASCLAPRREVGSSEFVFTCQRAEPGELAEIRLSRRFAWFLSTLTIRDNLTTRSGPFLFLAEHRFDIVQPLAI